MKLGQKDLAIDSLKRAMAQIPDNEKTKENAAYLKMLTMVAKFNFEKKEGEEAIKNIEEGLKIKDDHSDLLFLKALYLLDNKMFDEMLVVLINCLLTLNGPDKDRYDYEFVGQNAINEVFNNLVPLAYKNATQHKSIKDIVKKLSDVSRNEYIKKAYDIMSEIDAKRVKQGE
jgi:tetratricopeptide (TPR) repeat protein